MLDLASKEIGMHIVLNLLTSHVERQQHEGFVLPEKVQYISESWHDAKCSDSTKLVCVCVGQDGRGEFGASTFTCDCCHKQFHSGCCIACLSCSHSICPNCNSMRSDPNVPTHHHQTSLSKQQGGARCMLCKGQIKSSEVVVCCACCSLLACTECIHYKMFAVATSPAENSLQHDTNHEVYMICDEFNLSSRSERVCCFCASPISADDLPIWACETCRIDVCRNCNMLVKLNARAANKLQPAGRPSLV
jgi:hypothetical protein